MNDSERLLTVADVAELLRVSRNTAYALCMTEIPVLRLGRSIRVDPATLRRWVSERQQPTNENASTGWTPALAQEARTSGRRRTA
jgi:excisionase family DNA binding protein